MSIHLALLLDSADGLLRLCDGLVEYMTLSLQVQLSDKNHKINMVLSSVS